MHCRSSTAHCPGAVRQCIAGVALPTAPRQWGSALQELHCPLPHGSEAVHCRSCTAYCLRRRGGGGAPAAVPRTVRLGVVPRGPHAGTAEGVLRLTSARVRRIRRTPENAPPSRPSGSKRRCTTTLRSDVLSRSRPPTAPNSPGSTRDSVPASTGTEGVGLPGHHPRFENVAGLNRTRPSTTMRTAGGLSTAGVASTVTLHDHAHRRWPGYPRVL